MWCKVFNLWYNERNFKNRDLKTDYFKGKHKDKDMIMMAVGYKLLYAMSYLDIVEVVHDRFHEKITHTTIMH